jgi:hypothetical protein
MQSTSWQKGARTRSADIGLRFQCAPKPVYDYHWQNWEAWYQGDTGPTSNDFRAYHTYEESDWNLKLREKIKSISVNLASNIAEYRETVDLFTDFAKGVWTTFRNIRHGGLFGNKKFTACDISSAWLMGVWGLKPLADDLEASYRKLDAKIAEPLYRKVTSGGEVIKRHSDDELSYVSKSSDRARFWVRLTPNGYDFTPGNIAEGAWEVMYLSTLIDWGIPIGDWLSSLDALKYVDDLHGTVTRKWWYYHKHWNGRFSYYTDHEWPTQVIGRTHQRDVFHNDLPIANLPSWEPSASWRKVITATALLKSMKCRRPRDKLPKECRLHPNGGVVCLHGFPTRRS